MQPAESPAPNLAAWPFGPPDKAVLADEKGWAPEELEQRHAMETRVANALKEVFLEKCGVYVGEHELEL